MSALNNPNKYIQRLVKVISEKEKLIDQLKQSSIVRGQSQNNEEEEHNSMV